MSGKSACLSAFLMPTCDIGKTCGLPLENHNRTFALLVSDNIA